MRVYICFRCIGIKSKGGYGRPTLTYINKLACTAFYTTLFTQPANTTSALRDAGVTVNPESVPAPS